MTYMGGGGNFDHFDPRDCAYPRPSAEAVRQHRRDEYWDSTRPALLAQDASRKDLEGMPGKTLVEYASEVHTLNREKGWFDSQRSVLEGLMLITTKVAEAADAWRTMGTEHHASERDGVMKPDDFGSEMADIFIRLLDECKRSGIDLDYEYERKMTYNRTRPYRHGGKRA